MIRAVPVRTLPDIAIMIEGQAGLNWERWRNVAESVEVGSQAAPSGKPSPSPTKST